MGVGIGSGSTVVDGVYSMQPVVAITIDTNINIIICFIMFAQISCILLRIICDFTPAFFAIHIVRLLLVISAVSSTSPGADVPTSNVIGLHYYYYNEL